MDDDRTAEGIEHLQAAARELLAAARSFIDVAEEVVGDPERFSGAAEGLISLVGGRSREAGRVWERLTVEDDLGDAFTSGVAEDESEGADGDSAGRTTASARNRSAKTPARKRKARSESRVTRISVD